MRETDARISRPVPSDIGWFRPLLASADVARHHRDMRQRGVYICVRLGASLNRKAQ
jgi:hypothetical protein